jgi:hypothetical protein
MSAKRTAAAAPARRDLRAWIVRYLRDARGAVSPILVVSLVPIIGALGMGAEGTNWWLTQRMLQNAADTAVIAAATNGGTVCSGGVTACGASSYTGNCSASPGDFDCEAVAAANGEGIANGAGNVSIYPQYLTSGCPGSLSSCYKVTITKSLPIHLLGIVGYRGTNGAQLVASAAIGGVKVATVPDCILSVATGGNGITTDGSPNVNLEGCSIQSNSSANGTGTGQNKYAGACNGHNLNADNFSSPSSPAGDNGCANAAIPTAAVPDPYLALDTAANVPTDSCGGAYSQENKSGGGLPTSNTLSGNVTWGASKAFCGDVVLSGNVTINSSTTVYIYNGRLDLAGNTLASGSGDGVTIVLTGQNSFGSGGSATTPYHNITGGGTLQIAAPTSGTWSGVAVYQTPYQSGAAPPGTTPTTWPCTVSQCLIDNNINTANKEGSNSQSLDITAAGSSPNLWVQGGFYFPNANFTISGAIDNFQGLTSNGCFLLIAGVVNLNGQGSIFQNSQTQCVTDGVTQVRGGAFIHVLYQ